MMEVCLRRCLVNVSPYLAIFCLALAATLFSSRAVELVVADFSTPTDPPLVKKFGFANSCAVPLKRYFRDEQALDVLRPSSIRLEMGLGRPDSGWTTPVVGGTPGNVQYSWDELDTLVNITRTNGVNLTINHSYTPSVLQREGWNFPPPNLRQWATCARELAYHYRTAGIRLGAHEVWSSPDLSSYFEASRGIYFQVFKQTALALREGDPDALIGAPVIAERAEWVHPFIGFVEYEKLPLDYFAFQSVNPGGPEQTWGSATNRLLDVRKALAASPRLATTEIRLSAFNPLPKDQCRAGGAVEQPALAATVLDFISQFLGEQDLTSVNWSSLMDAGGKADMLGVIDEHGNPRPASGAFAFYADMPVDRSRASAAAPLRVMASSDTGSACVVVWNPSSSTQPASVRLNSLPFDGGQLQIHQLDSAHPLSLSRSNAWSLAPQEVRPFDGTNAVWTGELAAGGIVYLKALPQVSPTNVTTTYSMQVVRLHRFFPERGKSNYADFNRPDWTARLGMGSEHKAVSMIGVNLFNCPTNLFVDVQTSGSPRKLDKESVLAVRVDIFDRNTFTKSLLYHSGLYDPARDGRIPWGTFRAPDQILKVNPDQPWSIELAGHISQLWGRRAIVTFILQNAGSGARAKFKLTAKR